MVSADGPDLWKCFREGMLKAFDEVCGKTKGRRDQGDTWWWNKDVREAIARKKDAHKNHDQKVKVLLDLDIGQEVHLAPTRRGSSWKKETCVQKLSDR